MGLGGVGVVVEGEQTLEQKFSKVAGAENGQAWELGWSGEPCARGGMPVPSQLP